MVNEEKWHLDRRIPLAVVFAIVFQTLGIAWYAATVSQRVTAVEERQTKSESVLALMRDASAARGERIAVVEESQRIIKDLLKGMDQKLDRLVAR